MTKKSNNSHHVVPNPNGGWDGKRANSKRASIHTQTKQDAVDLTRQISLNQKTELFIQNKDGKIASRDSHGNDPKNVKG
jgi:hypothetical protein